MPVLKDKYQAEVAPALMKKFEYKSVMQIPKLDKIVINVGCGAEANGNSKVLDAGVRVTLRGDRMWEFLDRFFNIALPRVRDFRGINPNSFDGRGNYAIGLKEQLIFPEIEYDQIDKIRGMDIAIVTTANTDEEARELLSALGAPFAK